MQDIQSFDKWPVIHSIAEPIFISEALTNHIKFSSRYMILYRETLLRKGLGVQCEKQRLKRTKVTEYGETNHTKA